MTTRKRIVLLSLSGFALILAAVLILRGLEPQQPKFLHATGVVQTDGGTAVAGATVRLVCASAEESQPMKELPARVCEGPSDSGGAFAIQCEWQEGDVCELSVMKPGFRIARIRYPNGGTAPLLIVLRAEAGA
jgi:hypothetical protein